MSKHKIYSVYVIELSKRAWKESAKLRKANPQFNPALECLYVGMTSKTPEERFNQHINGSKSRKGIKISSSLVEKYGIYLRPSLYRHLGLLTKDEALKEEKSLSMKLRRMRYAVWFN